MEKMILIYLLSVNFAALCLYGLDKYKAIKHQWRIPERNLIGIALFGGGVGAYLGMRVFHHKTKHPKFSIGVPIIIVIEAVIAALLVKARL